MEGIRMPKIYVTYVDSPLTITNKQFMQTYVLASIESLTQAIGRFCEHIFLIARSSKLQNGLIC